MNPAHIFHSYSYKVKVKLSPKVTKTQMVGWNVGLPSLIWHSAQQSRQLYSPAAFNPQGSYLVLISVRVWVDRRVAEWGRKEQVTWKFPRTLSVLILFSHQRLGVKAVLFLQFPPPPRQYCNREEIAVRRAGCHAPSRSGSGSLAKTRAASGVSCRMIYQHIVPSKLK